MADEIVDIVDENDNFLFSTKRTEAFQEKLRCRVAHCFLIDRATHHIALIIRSRNASFRPLHYAAIGGYVQTGENALQGMSRELQEEAGINCDLTFLGKYPFTDPTNGQIFIDNVYASLVDITQVKLDQNDIEGVELFTLDDLRHLVKVNPLIHILLPTQLAVLEKHYDDLVVS